MHRNSRKIQVLGMSGDEVVCILYFPGEVEADVQLVQRLFTAVTSALPRSTAGGKIILSLAPSLFLYLSLSSFIQNVCQLTWQEQSLTAELPDD